MTEFFICVLIMVIVEIYQDYLGLLRDEKEGETFKHRDTGFILWFRITLWSVIIYIFYRVLYYFFRSWTSKSCFILGMKKIPTESNHCFVQVSDGGLVSNYFRF